MKAAVALITICTVTFLLGCPLALALDPSLDVSQYAHTAWTVRDGFSLGNVYAMAQTPDGNLWLGSEFGLFRFDGVHAAQPPTGQHLPDKNTYDLTTVGLEVSYQIAEHATDDALTPAEIAVLRLIAAGNANKQIADQLSITEETVKSRVKCILSKLGANDRTHAAMIGLKRGIIEP